MGIKVYGQSMDNTATLSSSSLTEITPSTPDVPKVDTTPKGIPIENLIELAQRNLTNTEIAKIVGTSRENVSQRLKDIDLPGLKRYKTHRADSLTSLSRRMFNSITDDDIKEMSPHQRVVAGAIIYDKERLERGQSTQNISAQSTVEHHNEELQNIKQELDAMRAEASEDEL